MLTISFAFITMDRLTEVKKLIRSILIPQKNGYTIEQLSEDYFEMEGLGLPFQEFKYSSIIEFLKSMPDTVKFIGNKCYPVSDSSTAHIERMVAEQRDSGSGRRPPPRPQRSAPPVRRDSENHRREFDSHNRRPPPRIRTPSPARPVEVPSLEVCQNLRNASPSRRSPTFDVSVIFDNFNHALTIFFVLGIVSPNRKKKTSKPKRVYSYQVSAFRLISHE